MGAWIEIEYPHVATWDEYSRTPRWVRGLKYCANKKARQSEKSRTPRWVRGLKFLKSLMFNINVGSHPTMGAWIEM